MPRSLTLLALVRSLLLAALVSSWPGLCAATAPHVGQQGERAQSQGPGVQGAAGARGVAEPQGKRSEGEQVQGKNPQEKAQSQTGGQPNEGGAERSPAGSGAVALEQGKQQQGKELQGKEPQGKEPQGKEPQGKEYKEHEVKAAYLRHFLRYVQWPKERDDDDKPFVIGIVGTSPFGEVWKRVEGKVVEGTKRRLEVVEFSTVPKDDALRACHIVFVCTSEHAQLEAILASLADHAVLTVTEGDRMIDRGVAFGFVLKDRQVRVEMNTQAVRKAQLKVSAQLQRICIRRT